MKVFVSWSGELSKKIAQELKKWIPCMIQSVEVFYSPEDIEKGENWDSKLTTELECCNYGIVCLTQENTNAPWIHFEAGALAKKMDSRVTALLVDTKISDIKGPLSRFQATRFEKEDFYQLLKNINSSADQQIPENTLRTTFDAMWEKIYMEIMNTIKQYSGASDKGVKRHSDNSEILEEILSLVRKQSVMIENTRSDSQDNFHVATVDFLTELINVIDKYDKNNDNNYIIMEVLKLLRDFNTSYRLSVKVDRLCDDITRRIRGPFKINLTKKNQTVLSELSNMKLSEVDCSEIKLSSGKNN